MNALLTSCASPFQYTVIELPRARRVHQSFLTAPATTLRTFIYALNICFLRPLFKGDRFADVLLLNGPGTGVPLACACFLSRASAILELGLLRDMF